MSRVFSAPSKALLAGGYLVLDPAYSSFVTALSARMYAVTSVEEANEASVIRVESPQFESGSWEYSFRIDDSQIPLVITEKNSKRNPFAEATVHTLVNYVKPTQNYRIKVTIFSDSEYHTQDGTRLESSTNGSKKFHWHTKPIDQVPKTGLGSSAGLVTVLTTALLSIYVPNFKCNDERSLLQIHNVAQIAHCIAQKKVGSGFDVAAATYGSIVYRRFEPAIITQLVSESHLLSLEDYHRELRKVVLDTDWHFVTEKCSLPKGIRILMGDVAGGSETPKMVSQVLAWRSQKPEYSHEVWTSLNTANMALVDSLQNLKLLSESDPHAYSELISALQTYNVAQIKNLASFSVDYAARFELIINIVHSIENIRHWMRVMTRESGASIEPSEQTILLNNCNTVKGVLGGVVPGAGGYDAICLIVAASSISSIIESTKGSGESSNLDLSSINKHQFDRVSWLDLTEQQDGVLEENLEDFKGLL
ncbi:unnamed protein product [Kuraishia capsulata CBS 1993]|uniref:Phosphomevalonate kinase n=1 Tax=Kuraishia capsulata CBS 1993 TaxID=1382522 RepID=W6MFH8_9ASCO|nr:uncharacterized protein KUCA_T00000048001 [Kuraishia capsulata CBS 1993]CDK24088.1 unnamed protein product [Kuraishia capsulata CBS 1993]